MVKPPPRLVNPYVPDLFPTLHRPSSLAGRRPADHVRTSRTTRDVGGGDEDDTILEGGAKRRPLQKTQQRPRGRLELRPIVLETSSSSSLSTPTNTSRPNATSPTTAIATGYAKVSMGSTTVLCHVHAPVPVASLSTASNQYYDGGMSTDDNNNDSIMDEGTLAVHVHVAPHLTTTASSTSSGSTTTTTRPWERSLERLLHQSLLPSVPLRQYAKSAILLQLTVVSTGDNDRLGGVGSSAARTSGQLLSPLVLAATLALSDAGVELYDVVTCGRIALVDGEVLVDPDPHEEEDATVVLTVALMNSWKEVTYWNQQSGGDGVMTGERVDPASVNRAVECCLEVCKKLHKVAVRHFQQQLPTPATADEESRTDQQ